MATTVWLSTLFVASLIGLSAQSGVYNTGSGMIEFGKNSGLTMECRCDSNGRIMMVVEYMKHKDHCEPQDFWVGYHQEGSDDLTFCPFKSDLRAFAQYFHVFFKELGIHDLKEMLTYAQMSLDDILIKRHGVTKEMLQNYYGNTTQIYPFTPEIRMNWPVIDMIFHLRYNLDVDRKYVDLLMDILKDLDKMEEHMPNSDFQLYMKEDFEKMMKNVPDYFSPNHLPPGIKLDKAEHWDVVRAVIDVNRCARMKNEKKYYSKGKASGHNTEYKAKLYARLNPNCFFQTERFKIEYQRIKMEIHDILNKLDDGLLEHLKTFFPNATVNLGQFLIHPSNYLHPFSKIYHEERLNASLSNNTANATFTVFQPIFMPLTQSLSEFLFHAGSAVQNIILQTVTYSPVDIRPEFILRQVEMVFRLSYGNFTIRVPGRPGEIPMDMLITQVHNFLQQNYSSVLSGTIVKGPNMVEEYDLVCEYKGMSHVSSKIQIGDRTENMNLEMKLRLSLQVNIGGMWTNMRMQMGDNWENEKATGMVKIGDWIKISIADLPKGFYAGFRECRVYSKGKDLIILIKENSFTPDFMKEDWKSHAVEHQSDGYRNAEFIYRAFLWSEKARTNDKSSMTIECDVDICKDESLKHDFHESACTKKAGSNMMGMMMMSSSPSQSPTGPYGRKRRSVSAEPSHKVMMNFVVMGREECNSRPSVANGKTSLTDDVKIGSQATFQCKQGFNNKGAATQRCREMVQKADGLIYYRTATAWVPQIPPSCEDVDECLQNPCAASFECVNSIGSFLCRCPNGEMESDGSCHKKKTFSGTLDSAKIIYSPKLLLKNSVEFKNAEKLLTAELTKIYSSIFNSALSVTILTLRKEPATGVRASYRVDVVETDNNVNMGSTGLQTLVVEYIRSNNPLAFDNISAKIYEYPHCSVRDASNCHANAFCIEENLSFTCKCHDGFKDVGPKEKPGRKCEKHSSHHQHNNHHDHNEEEYHMGNLSYHATKRLIIGLGAAVIVLLVSIVVIVVVLCCRRGRRYPVDDKVPLHS